MLRRVSAKRTTPKRRYKDRGSDVLGGAFLLVFVLTVLSLVVGNCGT
jgi:hypothetical protein